MFFIFDDYNIPPKKQQNKYFVEKKQLFYV